MVLVVTFVGFLIHIYSAEFMIEDEGFSRFFAYMNLFVASMLTLLLANNLLLLYLGWEGVGLVQLPADRLLVPRSRERRRRPQGIHRDPRRRHRMFAGFVSAVHASGHAAHSGSHAAGFRAVAVGFYLCGRGGVSSVGRRGGQVGAASPAGLAAGCHGRPYSGERPAPRGHHGHRRSLSDRTHARALFALAPSAQFAVAAIGAVTLLLAGFSALTQHDIKRVLAYSTMSQIGYMFLALGVGAWQAAMFHFVTHAFFKALLFLGAGVIINALDDEHSIFRMGGLRKEMPVAFWTFLIAGCSLAGLPFITAGFFSKDLIIWRCVVRAAGTPGVLARRDGRRASHFAVYIPARSSGYSSARLGTPVTKRPGYAMTVPLLVLAFLSIVGGYLKQPVLSFLNSVLPRPSKLMPPSLTEAARKPSPQYCS
jgi:NADH-quinone oxidoreductase subunit L